MVSNSLLTVRPSIPRSALLLPLSLARAEELHHLGHAFCAGLRPFGVLDPAQVVLAVEGGQRLEEAPRLEGRLSGPIPNDRYAGLAGTAGAAEELAAGLDPVADDPALAVLADRAAGHARCC
jgi:hypothetical protein